MDECIPPLVGYDEPVPVRRNHLLFALLDRSLLYPTPERTGPDQDSVGEPDERLWNNVAHFLFPRRLARRSRFTQKTHIVLLLIDKHRRFLID